MVAWAGLARLTDDGAGLIRLIVDWAGLTAERAGLIRFTTVVVTAEDDEETLALWFCLLELLLLTGRLENFSPEKGELLLLVFSALDGGTNKISLPRSRPLFTSELFLAAMITESSTSVGGASRGAVAEIGVVCIEGVAGAEL
jgi:hypothetical protein